MEYITVQLYPGALTDTAAAILRTISRLGVWVDAPADLNHDQLRALLALRNAGYIEYAAYGGYKIRTNEYAVGRGATPADNLAAIERISILNTASMHRVLVVMKTGTAYRFDFTAYGWQRGCAAGLIALAESFGAPEVRRLQNSVKVYRNQAA